MHVNLQCISWSLWYMYLTDIYRKVINPVVSPPIQYTLPPRFCLERKVKMWDVYKQTIGQNTDVRTINYRKISSGELKHKLIVDKTLLPVLCVIVIEFFEQHQWWKSNPNRLWRNTRVVSPSYDTLILAPSTTLSFVGRVSAVLCSIFCLHIVGVSRCGMCDKGRYVHKQLNDYRW